MEYEVEIDGNKHRVRFFERDGQLYVKHAGGTFPVRVQTPLRDRVQVVQMDGQALSFGYHRGKESTDIVLDGVIYQALVRDIEHVRLASVTARRAAAGKAEIKAPMPGMVVTVSVAVGDVVKKNQSLLSLHAMKLENDIRSPRDGKIEAVLVKPNDVLEKGTVMVKLGPVST
jgi:biotin carboxyl carrier protein